MLMLKREALFLCILLLSICTALAAEEGLIAHWKFDEGGGSQARDDSGNLNHGTIYGAEWVTGVSGYALEIVDEDIVGSIRSSFDDPIVSAFTFAVWVYWHGEHPWTHSPESYIFDARDAATGGFSFHIEPDGRLFLRLQKEDDDQIFLSNSSVPVDDWTHVAVVFEYPENRPMAKIARIYIDGEEDSAAVPTASYRDDSEEAAMGNNHWAPDNDEWAPLNGVLDDVRLYDIALTEGEIWDLYHCIRTDAPEEQPYCDGGLFGEPASGYPGWVWFSIPLDPADCCDADNCYQPDVVLRFQCSGRLWYWDKYNKTAQVYQPPFLTWDLALGEGYLVYMDSYVGNPDYWGAVPPPGIGVKLGRHGWTWVGVPGPYQLGYPAFMDKVRVQYPIGGPIRTAAEDYALTPDNWVQWGWSFWDTRNQAPRAFTPYSPFGCNACHAWIGYRLWVNVGAALDEDDPDQVTLIWP